MFSYGDCHGFREAAAYGFFLVDCTHSFCPVVPPLLELDTLLKRETNSWNSPALYGFKQNIHHQSCSLIEEQLDPFSLVADELSLLATRLRAMVVAEVPKLASAAEYFFKMGVEGKKFRPTIKSSGYYTKTGDIASEKETLFWVGPI